MLHQYLELRMAGLELRQSPFGQGGSVNQLESTQMTFSGRATVLTSTSAFANLPLSGAPSPVVEPESSLAVQ